LPQEINFKKLFSLNRLDIQINTSLPLENNLHIYYLNIQNDSKRGIKF